MIIWWGHRTTLIVCHLLYFQHGYCHDGCHVNLGLKNVALVIWWAMASDLEESVVVEMMVRKLFGVYFSPNEAIDGLELVVVEM